MTEIALTSLWSDPQRRRVVRLCAAITRDPAAAEDLAQETLLEAWRNRHKLQDPAGADRWLTAIARNVCLRWARRRGQELAIAAAAPAEPVDVEVELGRSELEELLDRALSLLPGETRDVLVHHYVHDSPHAEIAARLGISEAAVSMRVSRGKVVLRRLLETEAGDPAEHGWTDTRVWCTKCGAQRIQMRRDSTHVAFRCPRCATTPGSVYDFGNPFFEKLVGDLVRPTAILSRAADWSTAYFEQGAADAECTRCSSSFRLAHYDGERRGLHGVCPRCGFEIWSSIDGIAQTRREAREFAKTHGRIRTLPLRETRFDGRDASLVRIESVSAGAYLDVLLDRDTLRLLAVR